jgi:hypothetical protein
MADTSREDLSFSTFKPGNVDYEIMPIGGLAEYAEQLVTVKDNMLPLIEIKYEAESRIPRIPNVDGVFEAQRKQLENIVATVAQIIDQSKLPDEALVIKPDRTGY